MSDPFTPLLLTYEYIIVMTTTKAVVFLYTRERVSTLKYVEMEARRLLAVVGMALCLAFGTLVGVATPAQASAPILLSGSAWLDGQGVNVCAPSTDPYCGGEYKLGTYSPNWWQCVELAQRLYNKMGWHSGLFGVSVAYQIYDEAPAMGMSRQPNGSISSIRPGDLVIHGSNEPYSGGAGHVTVVDYVEGSTVHVVEQNTANNDPTGQYNFTNGTLSRSGSGTIRGIVHDPSNNLDENDPVPPTGSIVTDDVFQASGTSGVGWRVSYGGTSGWDTLNPSVTARSTLAIGDFDHDGNMDDVFQASGTSGVGWRVSYGGTSSWDTLNPSTTAMDSLLLGDLDRDGYVDDVMQASGVSGIGWRVSYGGTSGWSTINPSTTARSSLAVGDLDRDGYMDDVFQASGVSGVGWRVSYGGTSSWDTLNPSMTTMDSLLLGDLDRDGYMDDVFQASGVSGVGWRVSYGGTSGWDTLNPSTTARSSLVVGDFDHDGKMDDIMQASGVSGIGWRVSYGGTSGWSTINPSMTTMDSLLLGDFN